MKYKIVRRQTVYPNIDLFDVYKRVWFWWTRVEVCCTLDNARRWIQYEGKFPSTEVPL